MHTHTLWLLGAGEEDLGAWCSAATVAQAGVATREREREMKKGRRPEGESKARRNGRQVQG